jgi:hypothetical protein
LVNGAVDLSALGDVRRRRDELLAQRSRLTLAVPMWGGELAARYRTLGEHDREAAARTLARIGTDAGPTDDEQALTLGTELLGRACVGLLLRGTDGDYHPVHDAAGNPVRFDRAFAEAAGWEAASTRDVVRAVFSNEEQVFNPAALIDHVQTVVAWMRDPLQAVEGELLGES